MKKFIAKIKGSRAARVLVAPFVALALVVGSAVPSMAVTPDPADPLAGGGDGIFTGLTAYLTTHLVPLVFGLAIISISIGLVLRWVKKAVRA